MLKSKIQSLQLRRRWGQGQLSFPCDKRSWCILKCVACLCVTMKREAEKISLVFAASELLLPYS